MRIGLVRQQLVAAQLEGRRVVAGKVATFAVGKVTLELTGEVKKTIGGSGEAKFWALTANAEAERTSGVRTHDHRRVALEALEAGPYVAALLPTATPEPTRSRCCPIGSGRSGGPELRPDRERAVRHAQHGRGSTCPTSTPRPAPRAARSSRNSSGRAAGPRRSN